jgi:thiol-disulfide isomerase/thioredoxin
MTRMRRWVIRGAAFVSVVVLATAAACGGGNVPEPPPVLQCQPEGLTSVGETIPVGCAFERIGGGLFRLSDLAGKPSVINFWASWCTFCIEEMPAFQKVYAAFGGRLEIVGADLLGVDGETSGAAETFGRSTGVRYPLIYDDGGLLYAHFSARLIMPVTIFVRPDGIVAYRQFGPLSETALRDILAKELGLR